MQEFRPLHCWRHLPDPMAWSRHFLRQYIDVHARATGATARLERVSRSMRPPCATIQGLAIDYSAVSWACSAKTSEYLLRVQ